MWIPGSIFYIIIMSVLFIRWMLQQEAKQVAEEREADAREAEDGAGIM